ncbi:MAG TPA: retropepsin-like aspartic protease [Bacteroidia bacterium]|nr:retropepsin-like aspartic protease [Bacteroidia bacterium]
MDNKQFIIWRKEDSVIFYISPMKITPIPIQVHPETLCPYIRIDVCSTPNFFSDTSITIDALIDTGAQFTHLKQELIDQLGLSKSPNHQKIYSFTENREFDSGVYFSCIKLPNNTIICNAKILKLPSENPFFDMVLGMDFLKEFEIHYNSTASSILIPRNTIEEI